MQTFESFPPQVEEVITALDELHPNYGGYPLRYKLNQVSLDREAADDYMRQLSSPFGGDDLDPVVLVDKVTSAIYPDRMNYHLTDEVYAEIRRFVFSDTYKKVCVNFEEFGRDLDSIRVAFLAWQEAQAT